MIALAPSATTDPARASINRATPGPVLLGSYWNSSGARGLWRNLEHLYTGSDSRTARKDWKSRVKVNFKKKNAGQSSHFGP